MTITKEHVHASRQLANRVERYHTWPTLHRQTTGEHANRVLQIYVEIFGMPRAEVLYYISVHDAGEQYASDVQYGAKRDVPGLREAINEAERRGYKKLGIRPPELTDEEFRFVKIADLMEMWEFACVEVTMGNRYGSPIARTLETARDMAKVAGCISRLENWVEKNGTGG